MSIMGDKKNTQTTIAKRWKELTPEEQAYYNSQAKCLNSPGSKEQDSQ